MPAGASGGAKHATGVRVGEKRREKKRGQRSHVVCCM